MLQLATISILVSIVIPPRGHTQKFHQKITYDKNVKTAKKVHFRFDFFIFNFITKVHFPNVVALYDVKKN